MLLIAAKFSSVTKDAAAGYVCALRHFPVDKSSSKKSFSVRINCSLSIFFSTLLNFLEVPLNCSHSTFQLWQESTLLGQIKVFKRRSTTVVSPVVMPKNSSSFALQFDPHSHAAVSLFGVNIPFRI